MSMLFSLRQVSQNDLDGLMADPRDIFFFLHGTESYQPRKGFFAKFFGDGNLMPQRQWQAPSKDSLLDLGKNWHILHYLFARCPWGGPLPQATLLAGGVELGDIDVGYGPARALRASDIDAFLDFLSGLNADEFGANVSKKDVEEHEIYYANWEPEDGKLLWEDVEALKNFLRLAKDRNNGVILYLD